MSLIHHSDIFGDFFNKVNYYEPRANVFHTKAGMTLEIELPGYSRSDINIEAVNGNLTVSASRAESKNEYTRREFGTESTRRSWVIPRTVDPDRIEATYEAGILSLELPYKSGTNDSRRKIEIR